MHRFTDKQLPEFERWLKEGLLAAARRGVLSAVERAVGDIVSDIIPGESPPPVDEGHYRAAWRAVKTEEGADLVNDMPYAPVIEDGARAENIRPGRKMHEALTAWVIRKGIAKDGEHPEQVAWAIMKSMQKKGIFNRGGQKGLKIGEKAKERAIQYLPAEVVRELRRM